MVEVLVLLLIATSGSNSGSAFMQPLMFKTYQQCKHVADQVNDLYTVNTPKCIQANIYIKKD